MYTRIYITLRFLLWFREWDFYRGVSKHKPNIPESDKQHEEEFKKVILISGPPGISRYDDVTNPATMMSLTSLYYDVTAPLL